MAPGARTYFGPAAPNCSAAQGQRVTPSGSSVPPGRLARCAPPGPHSNASQLRARRPLSQTNRGGEKVAPTRICDSSCRRPQSSPDDALGPLARRDGADRAREAGGAAADSTARPRSVCPAGSAGCTWGNFGLPCCLPGGGHRGRPLCTAPGAFRPWEPAPLTHPDTAVPRTASETRHQSRVPGLQGPVQTLPRHPGLCGGSGLDPTGMRVSPSLPRRTGGWMRLPAAAGCLGGSGQGPRGRGSAPQRERRALGYWVARVGASDLDMSPQVPRAARL